MGNVQEGIAKSAGEWHFTLGKNKRAESRKHKATKLERQGLCNRSDSSRPLDRADANLALIPKQVATVGARLRRRNHSLLRRAGVNALLVIRINGGSYIIVSLAADN